MDEEEENLAIDVEVVMVAQEKVWDRLDEEEENLAIVVEVVMMAQEQEETKVVDWLDPLEEFEKCYPL